MRTLKFTADTKEFYNIMYEGLCATETSGSETRILSRIFTKMEEKGKMVKDLPLFKLEVDSATIKLEDAEYELAKKLLNTVRWNGIGAKKAGILMDWLDTISPDREVQIAE